MDEHKADADDPFAGIEFPESVEFKDGCLVWLVLIPLALGLTACAI